MIAYLDDGNAWAAERLTREPGWVLDAALTHSGDSKVFAAYLHSASAHEIAELRLGKKTEQLYAQAEKLHNQLDRYAYGPPQIRFTDEDVDQARAAGVLIEFEGGPADHRRPPALPRARQGRDQAHPRRARSQGRRGRQGEEDRPRGKAPADPSTVAKRERDAQLRELTDQAHGANLDLGHALIHNLTSVDPTDIDVARFFVYALLGADHDSSPVHADRGADRPDRRRRRPPRRRRAAHATSPRPARTAPAAGCASTTATTATRRPRSRGCGSSSTAPRPPASSTAARWS